MNKKTTFQSLFSAFFICILLTFSSLYLVNATLGGTGISGSRCFDGTTLGGSSLIDKFNRAVYQNKSSISLVQKCNYTLFDRLPEDNIFVGKNDFLFAVEDKETGYNYIEDYCGNECFTAEEKANILVSLQQREAAYTAQNTVYLLVVLPNSQTVYSEYMPSGLGEKNENSRLTDLSAYLLQNGFTKCYDLTADLVNEKSEGTLYDNTDNSLNALGMYYVYRAVLDCFTGNAYEKDNIIAKERLSFSQHETAGRKYAQEAGMTDVIKNQTVSLSNDVYYHYRFQFKSDFSAQTIRIPSDYSTLPNPTSLLLQFTQSRDSTLLEPYFSNTFDKVTYQNDLSDNEDTFVKSAPDVVIQFIHENELSLLLED